MVFGDFDGLHEGHRFFLQSAKKYGNYLIVAVSQDHIIKHLKGEYPIKNFAERFEHLETYDEVNQVVIGDPENSPINLIKKYNPDIVVLSKNQDFLKKEIEHNYENFSKKIELKTVDTGEIKIY